MQLLEPHCIQIVATQWLQGHFSVLMMISVGSTKSDVSYSIVYSAEKWCCDAQKKLVFVFDFIYFWKSTSVDSVRRVFSVSGFSAGQLGGATIDTLSQILCVGSLLLPNFRFPLAMHGDQD